MKRIDPIVLITICERIELFHLQDFFIDWDLSPEKRNLPELQLLVKPKLKSFKARFVAFIVDSF